VVEEAGVRGENHRPWGKQLVNFITCGCDSSAPFFVIYIMYVIKFVSDLRQVGGFLWILLFPSTNKTDRHDITEILLKVTLNTLNHRVYNFWLIHHETVKYIACEKDYFVPVDAIFQSSLNVSC
jgi:hypothetical protein